MSPLGIICPPGGAQPALAVLAKRNEFTLATGEGPFHAGPGAVLGSPSLAINPQPTQASCSRGEEPCVPTVWGRRRLWGSACSKDSAGEAPDQCRDRDPP